MKPQRPSKQALLALVFACGCWGCEETGTPAPNSAPAAPDGAPPPEAKSGSPPAQPPLALAPRTTPPSSVEKDGIQRSGRWRYNKGEYACDGYLTSNPDEGYCSQQPPLDWKPFDYDDTVYFVQPLSGR
jgi:hypothetical protein